MNTHQLYVVFGCRQSETDLKFVIQTKKVKVQTVTQKWKQYFQCQNVYLAYGIQIEK